MLGIVVAVAAVLILFSSISGLKATVLSQLEKMGADKIIVAPGSMGMMNLSGIYFSDADVRAVRSVPGVKLVLPLAAAQASVEYAGKKENLLIGGADPGTFSKMYEALGAYVESGRPLREGDKYAAFVGYLVAHDAFGRKIRAGTSIVINGQRFRVVGVLKRTGGPMDGTIYIPISAFEEITGVRDRYVRIIALTSGGVNVDKIAERVKRVLKARRGQEDFHILTPERMANVANQILSVVEGLLVSIAAIALVVGAVGIMNTMYMSVTERTREIGVMKAVGATRGQIMGIFLAEAGLLGLIGGVVGALLGLGMTAILERILRAAFLDTYHANYSILAVLGLVAFAALVGTISGYFPAKEGADKDPIEAIRQ